MKQTIFLFSFVFISLVPLAFSQGSLGTPTPDPRCVPSPCDPTRELVCVVDPDQGRPRCDCRPGFIRFAGSCVSIETIETGCNTDADCPKENDVCDLQVGNANSQFNGICKCREGFGRDWIDGNCYEVFNTFTRGYCQIGGDPHIKAFDLLGTYGYQGVCDYVLVRDTNLEIQGRFSDCSQLGGNVSCVESIAFLAGSSRVEFTQNGLFVNGTRVNAPLNISGVVISNSSFPGACWSRFGAQQFRATFPDGVVIDYGQYCFGVKLPPRYFRNDTLWPRANFGTKGLCASWTNNTRDDGITRDGRLLDLYANFEPNNPNITMFAQSWKLPASENLFSTPNQACPSVKRGTATGGGVRQKRVICQDKNRLGLGIAACTSITIDPVCRNRYPWQSLLVNCLFDYCYQNSTEFVGLYQAQADALCYVDQNGLPPAGSGENAVNPFDRSSFTEAPTTNPSTTVAITTTPQPTTPSLARELTFTFWILFVAVLFFY